MIQKESVSEISLLYYIGLMVNIEARRDDVDMCEMNAAMVR